MAKKKSKKKRGNDELESGSLGIGLRKGQKVSIEQYQKAFRDTEDPVVRKELQRLLTISERKGQKSEVENLLGLRKEGFKTGLKKAFSAKAGIKADRRARGKRARAISTLFGTKAIGGEREGAGRPKGTYKYGIPISEYKKLQSRKRALLEQYRDQKEMELRRRGLSPERLEQIEAVRISARGGQVFEQPQERVQQIQLGVLETPQSVMGAADEDLEFRKFRADKTISPNTQNILRRLRFTQLKSQRDDVEMQRRLKERKMVSKAGSLLATPFIFNRNNLDFTGVNPEENILMAENVFKQREGNRIMRTGRPSVLQARVAGNQLSFFGENRRVGEY